MTDKDDQCTPLTSNANELWLAFKDKDTSSGRDREEG